MYKKVWLGFLLCVLLFGSCDNELNMGEYLLEPSMRLVQVDTLTVRVSNLVDADSVITSGRNIGFTGIYNDLQTGTAEAQSYIEFKRTENSETSKLAGFDSVVLVLRSDGSYYGDTAIYPAVKVHRVLNVMDLPDNGRRYSTASVPVDNNFLADTAFRMKKVTKKPEVEVRLSDEFGEWLFEGIRNGNDDFNSGNFRKTFPGLSVAAGTGSGCVHGWTISDSTCLIRIYYHITTSFKEKKTMEFKPEPSTSFYRMVNDKACLPPYTAKSDPVPSSKTGNKGILMSGTPMFARLDIPHLNNFLGLAEVVRIQNATLVVYPVYHSYDTVPLPRELNLYEHDPTSDSRGSALTEQTGTGDAILNGNLSKFINERYPHYEFNITSFITQQMGAVTYSKKALSITIPGSSMENTIQRLVFGDQNYWYQSEERSRTNRVQLKVTYATYNAFD